MRTLVLTIALGVTAAASAAGCVRGSRESAVPVPEPAAPAAGVTGRASSADTGTNPVPPAAIERDLEMYRGATDANIVWHILATDSLQVTRAQLALARTSDARVRALARDLLDRHEANIVHFHGLAIQEHTGIAPMATDPLVLRGRGGVQRLQRLSGAAFDTAFVRLQVMHYDTEVAALQRLAAIARDDDLEDAIEHVLEPVVRQHLDRARAVATAIGLDLRAAPTP